MTTGESAKETEKSKAGSSDSDTESLKLLPKFNDRLSDTNATFVLFACVSLTNASIVALSSTDTVSLKLRINETVLASASETVAV